MWSSLSGEFCFKESSNISPNFVLLRRQRNAHWHNRIKSGKTDTAAAVSCDFFVSQKKPWGGRLPNKGGAKKRNWRARRLSPGWKGQRQVIYFILKISLTQLIINSFKSLISSGSLKPILILLWTRNIRRVKKCPEITISGQWWQSRIANHKIAQFLHVTSRQGRFLFEPTGQSGEDCCKNYHHFFPSLTSGMSNLCDWVQNKCRRQRPPMLAWPLDKFAHLRENHINGIYVRWEVRILSLFIFLRKLRAHCAWELESSSI